MTLNGGTYNAINPVVNGNKATLINVVINARDTAYWQTTSGTFSSLYGVSLYADNVMIVYNQSNVPVQMQSCGIGEWRGIVINGFTIMLGSWGSSAYRAYVWGKTVSYCPTWSTVNGQDDLQWYSAGYWEAYGGAYWCEFSASNHPNKEGGMHTHFYDTTFGANVAVFGWNGWGWI